MMLENVDHIVRVERSDVAAAMRAMFTDTHNATEGTPCGRAGGGDERSRRVKRETVAVIATGSNVDHDVFAQVLGEKCQKIKGRDVESRAPVAIVVKVLRRRPRV